ncbi:MAG: type II secretion system inner membrane protein GspF [bacterium]
MAVFEYRAFDVQGKSTKGLIDADTPQDAFQKLRRNNIYPFELKAASVSKLISAHSLFHIFEPKAKAKEISLLTRQLATLLKAGLPLMQALSTLIDQIETAPVKKIFIEIREKVKSGMPLSKALSEYPQLFSRLYIHMVRAGEASGSLDLVLVRLAEYMEKRNRQKNKIWSTLAYPIFMVFIGMAVVVFLMIYVIPTITNIFIEMQQSLPLVTRLLIQGSGFVRIFWAPLILIILFILIAFRKYRRTASGGLLIDTTLLKIPILGELIRKIETARFAQTLGTLVSSGIPILDALSIVKDVLGNQLLAKAMEEARFSIQEGEDLAVPLKRAKIFSTMVTDMIAIGEKSGQLEEMLANIGENFENEVDMTINSLTSILEPAIILLMGIVVAFIVVSILVPIFEMNQLM